MVNRAFPFIVNIWKIFSKNWYVFLFLSIGWELLEYILTFELAKETLGNRFSDVVINCLGFYIGNNMRKAENPTQDFD